MDQNIHPVDRYLRLVSGCLALAAAQQVKGSRLGQSLLMLFGAMKVAEGVTGWCPLTYALETRTSHEHSHRAVHRVSPGGHREALGARTHGAPSDAEPAAAINTSYQ